MAQHPGCTTGFLMLSHVCQPEIRAVRLLVPSAFTLEEASAFVNNRPVLRKVSRPRSLREKYCLHISVLCS